MTDGRNPVFRTAGEVSLIGMMCIYDSQQEASEGIPQQWCSLLMSHPSLKGSSNLYGASPCTNDRKIHYLAGVAQGSSETVVDGEHLSLAAGEYAVVQISDPASLRDTWTWLLGTWLVSSGRLENNTPEFERYTHISEAGTPIGPVEIWIPLQPRSY